MHISLEYKATTSVEVSWLCGRHLYVYVNYILDLYQHYWR